MLQVTYPLSRAIPLKRSIFRRALLRSNLLILYRINDVMLVETGVEEVPRGPAFLSLSTRWRNGALADLLRPLVFFGLEQAE